MSEGDFPANLPLSPASDSSRSSDQSIDVDESLLKEGSEDSINDYESIDNDWETVVFPNMINVDLISLENNEEIPETMPSVFSGISTVSTESLLGNSNQKLSPKNAQGQVTLIQALHECNRDLMERVSQLEIELKQSQSSLKKQENLCEKNELELKCSQSEINRLFGKLEQANQVIQQQAVVTENLTERLEKSQSQLAYIERECALTQQRYNELLYQLVQSENSCRELRSRLHRQQRQTLQFKAALEKCLERTTNPSQEGFNSLVKSQIDIPVDNVDNEESMVLDQVLNSSLNDSKIETDFHSHPVKPWSDIEDITREYSPRENTEPSSPMTSESETILTKNIVPNETSSVVELKEEQGEGGSSLTLPNFPSFTINHSEYIEHQQNPEGEKGQEIERQREGEYLITMEPFSEELPTVNRYAETHWIKKLTYGTNQKKRQSLAEIQLPSFC
ncbi:MAG: coiled-coil domain-containing protein [Microcoleaceae cyanobacterium]